MKATDYLVKAKDTLFLFLHKKAIKNSRQMGNSTLESGKHEHPTIDQSKYVEKL
jgi:hypothetical protein